MNGQEEQLIGDQITRLAQKFRLDWVAEELQRALGVRCNCDARRRALNELHRKVQNYVIGRK